jgi:hypothetical protein
MGRLHVSQTGAEPTIAEMELREGGEYRRNSWAGGCGLLSTIAAGRFTGGEVSFCFIEVEQTERVGLPCVRHSQIEGVLPKITLPPEAEPKKTHRTDTERSAFSGNVQPAEK